MTGRARRAAVTALAVVAAAIPAGLAEAATVNSAVIYREEEGVPQRTVHSGNANFTFYGERNWLYVNATLKDGSGTDFTFDFGAPYGYALTPGVYDRAQRFAGRENGRPGMDVGSDASGCNRLSGRFEVKDMVFTADGKPERFWIVFEQRCEGALNSTFGELRVGMPVPDGAITAHPGVVRWPPTEVGRPGFPVPVEVVAASATQVVDVAVSGARPGDFPIQSDGCSGQALGIGATCRVTVQFRPTVPGTQRATLVIREAGGGVREVALDGFSWGGTTRFVVESDTDDRLGRGAGGSYTFANADEIVAGGDRRHLGYGVAGKDGLTWGGALAPPTGDILTVAHYPNATAYPGTSSTPGIDLSLGNTTCGGAARGEFDIREARFHPDGLLRSVAVDFVQYCGSPGAMRGTLEFRKGDQTPPPPWMTWRSAGTPLSGEPAPEGSPTPAPVPGDAPQPGTTTQSGSETPAPEATSPPASRRTICADRDFAPKAIRRGTPRADRIRGRRPGELIFARAGNDRVNGRGGRDCIAGGRGNDVLIGGPGRDVLDCGRGERDVVRYSRGDRVRNCERRVRVRRR